MTLLDTPTTESPFGTVPAAMVVVVPYVDGMLHPSVLPAIDTAITHLIGVTRASIIPVQLITGDDESYWDLLNLAWGDTTSYGADLVIVEQDVEIPPNALNDFAHCPEPWCSNPYDCASMLNVLALGCTRFSLGLRLACPLLPQEVVGYRDNSHLPPKHWKRLDTRIAGVLRGENYQYTCHAHNPAAIHHHPYRVP